MDQSINTNKSICKSCGDHIQIERAKFSNKCVPCKTKQEGDFYIYIDEPLGTRKEFREMSSAQSRINRSIKF